LPFVGAVLAVVAVVGVRLRPRMRSWSAWVAPYVIGTVAMLWVAERIAAF